jgi:hypothetical protein
MNLSLTGGTDFSRKREARVHGAVPRIRRKSYLLYRPLADNGVFMIIPAFVPSNLKEDPL